MTQLLISVKNVQETWAALEAGVDMIDLKDPCKGALGALDLALTKDIVNTINGHHGNTAVISATVGEHHANNKALLEAINDRALLGVDIIKIAVDDLFEAPDFFEEIKSITKQGVKLVAVMFADQKLQMELLPQLKSAGFYGAMLDTQKKTNTLPNLLAYNNLHYFVQMCEQLDLKSGLAGSLKPQDIEKMAGLHATYIGFRGGACHSSERKGTLMLSKVIELKNMLHKHNNARAQAQKINSLALHS